MKTIIKEPKQPRFGQKKKPQKVMWKGVEIHTGDAEDTAYRVVVKTLVQAEKDKSTGLLTYYNGNKVETFRVLRGDFETEPNPGVYEVP